MWERQGTGPIGVHDYGAYYKAMIFNFFDYCDWVAGNDKQMFVDRPYLHHMCGILEQVISGDLPEGKKNLIINIPPRCFKTETVSKRFVAYCLAEIAPDCEFILTSATMPLAASNSLGVKRLISQPWHQSLYPDLEIAKKEKDTQTFFKTSAGGCVYSAGLNGTITGFGAGKVRSGFGGAIIIDDPLKAADAASPTMVENCVRYYLEVLKSRRNNANNTPFILIAQRLHVDDLPGWLLKNESQDWHLVQYPAIDDKGVVLNDVTLNKQELETLKVVSPQTYFAQYQQVPIVPGGNIIKLPWWRVYDPAEGIPRGLRYITADTAYGEHELSDASVLQLWEASEKGLYLIDSMYGSWDFPTLLRNAKAFWTVAGAREFWVEAKASGTSLAQTLSEAPLNIPASGWLPKDFDFPNDKVGRMQEAAWLVHGGRVFVPKGNIPIRIDADTVLHVSPSAAALMEEASQFARDMSHLHDDHCDAFTMACSLYKDALSH